MSATRSVVGPGASPAALVVTAPRWRVTVRPALAFQAMLLLLILGNVGRLPLGAVGDRAVPLLVTDLVTVGVIAIGAVWAAQHRSLEFDAVASFGLLFAGIGLLSTLAAQPRFGLSFGELAIALAFLARWLAYFGLYIVGINTLRRADVAGVWKALETCVLVFAAFGILQAAFLPNFARIINPETAVLWDVQQHRLVSTLLDPNYAGAFIVMALLVELALISSGEHIPLWKPFLLALAMLLTLSRGTLLAFGAGLVVIVSVRGISRRVALLFGLAAAALLAELPHLVAYAASFNKLTLADASAQARLISWLRGWTVFRDHPIIGIGFNTWGMVQGRYGWETIGGSAFGIEGGLLFVAVLTGVVGLAVFVAMLGWVFVRSRTVWRDARQTSLERGLAVGTASVLAAIVVHTLFTNTLFQPTIMAAMWALCALVFVAGSARRDAPVRA